MYTAFGIIDTNPETFIVNIFAILLSAAGGIALFLIIRSGYTIMTSQGKPDQIQNGRDQLIAAIVGLIFFIFSFVILQVIGVDILRIDSFSMSDIQQGGTCDPSNDRCAGDLKCTYQGGSPVCSN